MGTHLGMCTATYPHAVRSMRMAGLSTCSACNLGVIHKTMEVYGECLHAQIIMRATQEYATLTRCSQSPVEELRSEVLLELFIDQSLDAVVAAVFL